MTFYSVHDKDKMVWAGSGIHIKFYHRTKTLKLKPKRTRYERRILHDRLYVNNWYNILNSQQGAKLN